MGYDSTTGHTSAVPWCDRADMSQAPLWLLDVDGPVVDPSTRAIKDPQLLDNLVAFLAGGGYVAFNTGRDAGFVRDRVMGPLRLRATEQGRDVDRLLDRVFVVAEMGGITMRFAGAAIEQTRDPLLTVNRDLTDRVKALVAAAYSDVMFVDDSKQTMLSIEKNHGVSLDVYDERRRQFALDVNTLVNVAGLEEQVRVGLTTIAVDLQAPGTGKALGADRVLSWLSELGITPASALCVGDSGSDLAMADRLHERLGSNVPVTYVNVGPASSLDRVHEIRYTVVHAMGEPTAELAAFGKGAVRATSRELA